MSDVMLEYTLAQSAKAADLATNDPEIHEALENTAQWANVVLEKMVGSGIPVVHASSLIVATINITLNRRVLQPPDED